MKLFYIEKDLFILNGGDKQIQPFIDDSINSREKRIDHALGLFLLDSVLKNVYKKESYEIIKINGKPTLKDDNLYFSISHTGNIVLIGFDENNIGLDIEMKKLRDIKKLRKRYNKNFKSLEEFYTFWTQYEAVYKLQDKPKKVISFDFKHYYTISIASSSNEFDFKMYDVTK